MSAASNRIVFVNQNAGYLMIDIIHAHLEKYEQVTLITGRLIERDVPLDARVRIRKIVEYRRNNTLQRLWTWGVGFLQIAWLIKTRHRNDHLYLVSNPPLTGFLPLICRNPFSLLIFDVYPETLVAYRVLGEQSFAARWWHTVNASVFPRANKIFVLSEGMASRIARYVERPRIVVAPLWTHPVKPGTGGDENPFVAANGLQHKFIVLYSGNYGRTHNLDLLIRAASQVHDPRVAFVFVGDGEYKSHLMREVESNAMTHCHFIPWQPPAMLPHMLSAASLGVVALDGKASSLSVPSRVFNFLAASTPLLCLAQPESELAALILNNGCGACFHGDDSAPVAAYIRSLLDDEGKLNQLRGLALTASLRYTPENAKSFVA